MSFKLLIESPDPQEFEYILEEKKRGSKPVLWIKGPYMMAEEVNRNKRVYKLDEMVTEVGRYKNEMIGQNRALGELNHPTSAEVDLERACHMVTELNQDGNVFVGKSKVLSTPMGMIVESLINDGTRLGMSTRSLGMLDEAEDGINHVKNMRLVAVDCVADPSCAKAFVNGILESKQWICNEDGAFCELYDKFESKLDTLPVKGKEEHIINQVSSFLNNLKTI
tara:strand:+ start:1100 stop:1768 length:669 start_codon:yes stop_codon:yes gene_type:complete